MVVSNILLVALLIGVLITFHEFGHLIFAKLFHIPVEVFSIGFGPVILKKKWGGTEYRLAAIPLGGFIRMTGEEEFADKASGAKSEVIPAETSPSIEGFNDKPLYARAAVIAAGPVSNLILGFLILAVMFAIFGIGYTGTALDVKPGSPAEQAGLLTGDLVIRADRDTVASFESLEQLFADRAGERVELEVLREGTMVTIAFPVPESYGGADDMSPVVGSVTTGSRAEQAGIMPGDTIVELDGKPVTSWTELAERVGSLGETELGINVRRDGGMLALTVPEGDSGAAITGLGIEVDLSWYVEPLILPVVGRVRGGGPAHKAGIRAGDTLVSAAGITTDRWSKFVEVVSARAGETFVIEWQRDGRLMSNSVTPASETDQLSGKRSGAVGIWVDLPRQRLPLHQIIGQSLARTGFVVVKTFEILWQVATRQISTRAIGGPIMVAKIAYEGTTWGAEYFLALWSLLSINLFVVNLLPIPVLDGGRIGLFVFESVRRRKLSEKELTWAMNIGWIMIGAVILLVLFNDILRLIKG